MKKNIQCEKCEIKGYSSALCKFHRRNLEGKEIECPYSMKEISKSALVGAGIGFMAAFVGVAAVPASVMKAMFGHVMATKVSVEVGGTATGAGINVFRKTKKAKKKEVLKKKIHLPVF
ncbi:MAG: hypothetical protein HQK76_13080 [Desulfobacterales bacterium]|nr:hypothetical protein [Desulfobacterales bacterium]